LLRENLIKAQNIIHNLDILEMQKKQIDELSQKGFNEKVKIYIQTLNGADIAFPIEGTAAAILFNTVRYGINKHIDELEAELKTM
jgi:hypothetical protein